MIDRHHLLECILWPNGDGTFRKIINTQKRLEELGIYKDYKLTIPIEHGAHSAMHWKFERGTEYERAGENHSMYGRTCKDYPQIRRSGDKNGMYGKGDIITGEKNGMYGRSRDKSPCWKGDTASPEAKYRRALEAFKNNLISKETFQTYKDARNEYIRNRKKLNGR